MKFLTKIAMVITTLLVTLFASSCSIVSTGSDVVALHYDGGLMTAEKFIACVPVGTYEMNGMGDKYYEYPTSLRYYRAVDAPGAESGPISVVSKDNAEMLIPVEVSFALVTECETLKNFHEKIALRDRAFWGGSDFPDENNDGTPDGWLKILDLYIGGTLDATLDRASQGHGWRDLWNNPTVKVQLEQQLENELSNAINTRMGGEYFAITDILVQKPEPANADLKEAANKEQIAVANAKSAEEEARAQEKAADAKVKAAQAEREVEVTKAQTEASVIEEQIRVMGEDAWLKKYGIDHGITPWPNPVVPGANTASVPK